MKPACFVVNKAGKLGGQTGFLQDERSGQARHFRQFLFISDFKRRHKADARTCSIGR